MYLIYKLNPSVYDVFIINPCSLKWHPNILLVFLDITSC